MALELITGWLVQVVGDRLLADTAEEKALRHALEDSINDVVAQTAPHLQEGVRSGLLGCFARPADGLRLDRHVPVDRALAQAVAAQVATLKDWRALGPPPRPFLEVVPVDLAWLEQQMAAAVITALRHTVAQASLQGMVLSGYLTEILAAIGKSNVGSLTSPVQRELAYWATVRQTRNLAPRSADGGLAGRDQEVRDLIAFARGPESYRLVVGEAWTGKTALLAEVAVVLHEDAPDVDVVCYFLSRQSADATSTQFLAAAVPQLAALLGENCPAADVHNFRDLWARLAAAAARTGRHLLLVVDGLDEDLRTVRPIVAALLPLAGPHAHVLVSSRPQPETRSEVVAGHPLRGVRAMELAAFEGAAELAALARQEIDDLIRREGDGFVTDILGFLTAAAGPLTLQDLTVLHGQVAPQANGITPTHPHIRRFLTSPATTRSLRAISLRDGRGRAYQFAHESLLRHAESREELADPAYRRHIHRWADSWTARGWRDWDAAGDLPPHYLLDSYPVTLGNAAPAVSDRLRELAQQAKLVNHPGWVCAAIGVLGVDGALARIGPAPSPSMPKPSSLAAPSGQARLETAAMARTVSTAAHSLRDPAKRSPRRIAAQLCLQAMELGELSLADQFRSRTEASSSTAWVPMYTTRRTSRAFIVELGRHGDSVNAVAVLPDGRLITAGPSLNNPGQLLIWDPATPGANPIELGRHSDGDDVGGMAVLPDGRLVTAGARFNTRGRLLVWNPATPGANPVELGYHGDSVVGAAVLSDGRLATVGAGIGRMRGERVGQLLVWHPATPGADPVELGYHGHEVGGLAILPDGRLVTAGDEEYGQGLLLLWDPGMPGADPVELGHHGEGVRQMAVLSDGRLVTAGAGFSGRGRLAVWDPATSGADPIELGQLSHDGVRGIAELPDGRLATAVYSSDRGQRLLIWDPVMPGTEPIELGHHDGVGELVVLPDGLLVSAGSGYDNRGQLLVWDPVMPGADLVERGDGASVHGVALLPDGRLVTAGAGSDDRGQLLVWDPAMFGAGPVELGNHHEKLSEVVVLPDGLLVTVEHAEEARLLVWDPATPCADPVELLGRRIGGEGRTVALPDSRLVTSVIGESPAQLLIWDPAMPGADPVELGQPGGVDRMVVLTDGRLVTAAAVIEAAAGNQRQLLVWDPAMPTTEPVELGELEPNYDETGAMVALRDGRFLSTSRGQLLVWDPAMPDTRPVEFGQFDDSVGGVAVLPDGRLVTSGGLGSRGRLLVWDLTAPGSPPDEIGRHDISTIALVSGTSRDGHPILVVLDTSGTWTYWRQESNATEGPHG